MIHDDDNRWDVLHSLSLSFSKTGEIIDINGNKISVTDNEFYEKEYVFDQVDVKNEYNDDVFISIDGNDGNPGTKELPVATIGRAKELVKKIDGDGMVNVWFMKGTYYLSETIVFDESDRDNVNYAAYNGEKVIIKGSLPISGWTETEVNGVKAWYADCSGLSDINTLFSGEKRLSQSRYPEKDNEFLFVREAKIEDSQYPNDYITSIHKSFYANLSDIYNFYNVNDVTVRILHYWKDEMSKISSIDFATGKITLSKPSTMRINANDKFFFENVFECLNEPGEWYHDRQRDKIYYIPFSNEKMDDTFLYAGNLVEFINISNVCNIKFYGITFCESNYEIGDLPDFPQAASDVPFCVDVVNSSGVSFTRCNFKNLSVSGIKFGNSVRDSQIQSSLFSNIGAVPIKIGGDANNEDCSPYNIVCIDNRILEYGRVFYNAVGLFITFANNCEITNNEISDGYYTAISIGWNWGYSSNATNNIKVKNNLIYNIGQSWLSDMGGIYTLGIQPGTEIFNNVIFNVKADVEYGGYGGWGIYLDEGSSYIKVYNNLVYDCNSSALHCHYGKENIIENNILSGGDDSVVALTRMEEHVSLYLQNNVFLTKNGRFVNVRNQSYISNKNNIYFNFTYEMTGDEIISAMESAESCLYVDPLIVDPENDDYHILSNSPAFKIGFTRFDFSSAGTITNFSLR